jgi:hypothetical protein
MSTVILDTITGKSTATTITIGSTPVVSASANSMTIRGEGSAQTSIQQGLAKSWVNFNGTGTIAARDSLNVGSLTDNGTGDYTVNLTNNMNNDDYAVSWNAGLKSVTWGLPIFIGLSGAGNNDCFSTSKYRFGSSNPADGLEDNNMCNAISLGDLA